VQQIVVGDAGAAFPMGVPPDGAHWPAVSTCGDTLPALTPPMPKHACGAALICGPVLHVVSP